jgi:CBS domain-containing protein
MLLFYIYRFKSFAHYRSVTVVNLRHLPNSLTPDLHLLLTRVLALLPYGLFCHVFCVLGNLFLLFILKNCMQEIVSQIMTRHVVTISSNRSALDAALLMKENRISSLIVQDKDNKSLGIITERDFVKRVCAEDKKSSEVKISELMSKIQTFAELDTPVDVAVQRMINNRIRRLPVVSDGNVVGIITVTDLAKELRRLMLTKGIVELID